MQEPVGPTAAEAPTADSAAADPAPHFRSGRDLFDAGRLREAVPALQQAIRLKPDHVEALVLLGRALVALGNEPAGRAALQAALARAAPRAKAQSRIGVLLQRGGCHAEALAAFDAAIRLQPKAAAHHFNRGISLSALGRLDEAIASYRRAVEIDPRHVKALNNLGNCLRRTRGLAEAETVLRRAVELDPHWSAPHYNLGRVLAKRERFGEAVVAFRQAIRLQPDHADPHASLGVVLQEIGQLDAARASYRRAIALSPDHPAAHALLAHIDEAPADEAVLARLEARVASRQCPALDRQHLHFALARRYEQIRDYGRAFDHLVAGNRLKRAELDYDLAADLDRFRRLAELFDAAFLARHDGHGDPSGLPIFVVGMPRSGTTLIEQILASHSAVHGAGEVPFMSSAADAAISALISRAGGATSGIEPAQLHRIAEAYLAQLSRRAPHARRIVDKMLTNFIYVGLIRLALPNARVIHARRHPLDTCVSIFRALFSSGLAFSYDLTELGRYYAGYARLMRHWHEVLPGFVLDVQYEHLLDDQRGVTERMLAHCGLAWEDACLRFHETQRPVRTASVAQVRQPIYRSSTGTWQRYGERLRPMIEALGEEAMEQLAFAAAPSEPA
ncbi:MAG: sulfotransferase [Alphaproteobacteria bacterium]|nr:MAG: sulfotransferase [Alphaproteobacteria bacterium]